MPGSLDPDDKALIAVLAGASGNDAAGVALAALMHRYKKLAYAVALDACRDRSLADDVFQETFVRMTVWLRARRGIEVHSFPRLLCAFVRRTAREFGRQKPTLQMPDIATSSAAVDMVYAREILGTLPGPAREVLERVLIRGMSSQEAAAELGLTPENVRLIKHRTIRAIRDQQARDLAALGVR
jgi:RNA polymerase sigma factor (sigma-70 family)